MEQQLKPKFRKILVTASEDLDNPLKCGQCLFDLIQNHNYEITLNHCERTFLIYNRNLNHIHITTLLDDNAYSHPLFTSSDTKYYEVYLEHSDTCPNRIYRRLC